MLLLGMKPYVRKLTGGLHQKWGYFTVPKKIIGNITNDDNKVACWLDTNHNLIISKDPKPEDINGIFFWKKYYYATSGSVQFRIPYCVFDAWEHQYPNHSFDRVKILVLSNNSLQITLC